MDPERDKVVIDWLKGNKLEDSVGDFVLIGIGLLSVITGWSFENEEYSWFSRSGSIMVLIGAILEYRYSLVSLGANLESIRWAKGPGNPVIFELARHQKFIKYTAHGFVIIGTVIWGFGDLMRAFFGSLLR